MNERTALMLVGPGSARPPDSAPHIMALAAHLRQRGPWAEVAAAFMKQSPTLADALTLVSAPRVVVIPVFAGRGHYTDTLIPREMGLGGALTRRDGRTILYAPPAGEHPRIPTLMAARAESVARKSGWTAAGTSLLLIAHGSSRPGGSGQTPRAIAAAIAAGAGFAEVALAFLEQAPFAADWPDLVRGPRIVALPLLVAQGLHASQDIPPLFGLRSGQTGPVESHGRVVRLAAGLGAEPDLVEIVADMALTAIAAAVADRDRAG